MSAITAAPRVQPYVMADTAPFRTALLGVGIVGGSIYVPSALFAWAVSASSPSQTQGVVNRVLAEVGHAAPWLLPMVLSALIAGLAVALVPGWTQRNETLRPTTDFDDLRLLVGYMCLIIGGIFMAWALWIVTAWIVPGWSPAASASGVLVGLMLITILATLGSRAARGTLPQRHLDARRTRLRLLRRRRRTRLQTIPGRARPAQWPVRVVLLLCALALAVPFSLAALQRIELSTAMTILGAVSVFELLPLALCLYSFSDIDLHQRTVNLIAGTGITVTALATLAIAGLDVVGVVAAVVVVSPIVATIPWHGKYLLAGFGHAPLEKAIASNDEYLSVLRHHLSLRARKTPS